MASYHEILGHTTFPVWLNKLPSSGKTVYASERSAQSSLDRARKASLARFVLKGAHRRRERGDTHREESIL